MLRIMSNGVGQAQVGGQAQAVIHQLPAGRHGTGHQEAVLPSVSARSSLSRITAAARELASSPTWRAA